MWIEQLLLILLILLLLIGSLLLVLLVLLRRQERLLLLLLAEVGVLVDSCLADRLFLSRVRRGLKPCGVARRPGWEWLLVERGLLLLLLLYKCRWGGFEGGGCLGTLRDPLDIVFVGELLFLLEKVVVETICL